VRSANSLVYEASMIKSPVPTGLLPVFYPVILLVTRNNFDSIVKNGKTKKEQKR
jgi:hypothetical protein